MKLIHRVPLSAAAAKPNLPPHTCRYSLQICAWTAFSFNQLLQLWLGRGCVWADLSRLPNLQQKSKISPRCCHERTCQGISKVIRTKPLYSPSMTSSSCAGMAPAVSSRAGGSHGQAGRAGGEDRPSGGRLQAILGSAQSRQTGTLNRSAES